MQGGCHAHRAEDIPFDSICDGDPGRKAPCNNVSRVQEESELCAGLQEVILLQRKVVDRAYSLVWR